MWRAMLSFIGNVLGLVVAWIAVSFGVSMVFMVFANEPAPYLSLPLGAGLLWYIINNPPSLD